MNTKDRFLNAIATLKSIGFQGEVTVAPNLILINAFDKPSASLIRKALKKAKSAGDCQISETRGDCTVFTVIINDALRLPIQNAA